MKIDRSNIDKMVDKLKNLGVSEETIQIVSNINGYTEKTMLDILYAATGYVDFDQL